MFFYCRRISCLAGNNHLPQKNISAQARNSSLLEEYSHQYKIYPLYAKILENHRKPFLLLGTQNRRNSSTTEEKSTLPEKFILLPQKTLKKNLSLHLLPQKIFFVYY
jgi:hypothetical protein